MRIVLARRQNQRPKSEPDWPRVLPGKIRAIRVTCRAVALAKADPRLISLDEIRDRSSARAVARRTGTDFHRCFRGLSDPLDRAGRGGTRPIPLRTGR